MISRIFKTRLTNSKIITRVNKMTKGISNTPRRSELRTRIIKKTSRSLTATPIRRLFCSQGQEQGLAAPAIDAETLQRKQEYNEEILEIDEDNKVHIKFNDDYISYEIPDELSGTTYGKSPSD